MLKGKYVGYYNGIVVLLVGTFPIGSGVGRIKYLSILLGLDYSVLPTVFSTAVGN
jgi:hypothetical protein